MGAGVARLWSRLTRGRARDRRPNSVRLSDGTVVTVLSGARSTDGGRELVLRVLGGDWISAWGISVQMDEDTAGDWVELDLVSVGSLAEEVPTSVAAVLTVRTPAQPAPVSPVAGLGMMVAPSASPTQASSPETVRLRVIVDADDEHGSPECSETLVLALDADGGLLD